MERRIQAFEHTCYRRLLCILYTEHRTNDFVGQVTNYAGRQEPLLLTVKRRHLAWYCHISRQDSLAKIILQGAVEDKQSRSPGWIILKIGHTNPQPRCCAWWKTDSAGASWLRRHPPCHPNECLRCSRDRRRRYYSLIQHSINKLQNKVFQITYTNYCNNYTFQPLNASSAISHITHNSITVLTSCFTHPCPAVFYFFQLTVNISSSEAIMFSFHFRSLLECT